MKIFQTIRKNFATAGISPNLSIRPHSWNGKIVIGFLLLHSALICSFGFTFYEAKTLAEYTQSTYVGAAAALLSFFLLILIFDVKNLFKIIDATENVANTSK